MLLRAQLLVFRFPLSIRRYRSSLAPTVPIKRVRLSLAPVMFLRAQSLVFLSPRVHLSATACLQPPSWPGCSSSFPIMSIRVQTLVVAATMCFRARSFVWPAATSVRGDNDDMGDVAARHRQPSLICSHPPCLSVPALTDRNHLTRLWTTQQRQLEGCGNMMTVSLLSLVPACSPVHPTCQLTPADAGALHSGRHWHTCHARPHQTPSSLPHPRS